MNIKELKQDLMYEKEMLKQARTPRQRDECKHNIRILKKEIVRFYSGRNK